MSKFHPSFRVKLLFLMLFASFLTAQSLIAKAEMVDLQTDNLERYQLKRDGENFVRLDKKTGTISTCKKRGGKLVCQMAADDREILEKELSQMQTRLDALEEQLSGGDEKSAELKKPETKPRSKPDSKKEYSDSMDEEFDQAMDYSTKVLKRFFTMMKKLRRDLDE